MLSGCAAQPALQKATWHMHWLSSCCCPAPPRMQGFAPWPAEQLAVIGGGRRAYISSEADPTEQQGREAGQTAEEAGRGRRERALEAFKDHPQQVKGARSLKDGSLCRPVQTQRLPWSRRCVPAEL